MKTRLPQKSLLKVKVASSDREYLLSFINSRLKNKQKFTIFTPNPEILVKAYQSESLREVLNNADINIPDGIGVAKVLGIPVIKGREFMIDILRLLNANNMSVVLIGGSKKTMSLTTRKLAKDFPKLSVTTFVGPYLNENGSADTEVDREVQKDITDRVKVIKPDVMLIGFGAPKQEYWIDSNFKDLPVTGVMAVGGSFDFYAGVASIPPYWLSSIGLEWLWRLLHEPARAGRIINAVILFPLLVLKEKLSNKAVYRESRQKSRKP